MRSAGGVIRACRSIAGAHLLHRKARRWHGSGQRVSSTERSRCRSGERQLYSKALPAFMVQKAMPATPTTSYVKSDDVHVAYQVFGEGSLDLLFVPGFVSNIDGIWDSACNSGGAHEVARAGSYSSPGVGSVTGFVRHADRSERASSAGFPHGPPPWLHFIVLTDWKPLLRHPHLWLPEQRERVRRRIRAWSRRLLRRHRRTGRGTIADESAGLRCQSGEERRSHAARAWLARSPLPWPRPFSG